MTLALAIVVLSSDWAARRTQEELIRIIEVRFDADAELEEVTMSLFPRLVDRRAGLDVSSGPGTSTDSRSFASTDFTHQARSLMCCGAHLGLVDIDGFQIDVARGRKPEGPGAARCARPQD